MIGAQSNPAGVLSEHLQHPGDCEPHAPHARLAALDLRPNGDAVEIGVRCLHMTANCSSTAASWMVG
jgi:hypothetical protein